MAYNAHAHVYEHYELSFAHQVLIEMNSLTIMISLLEILVHAHYCMTHTGINEIGLKEFSKIREFFLIKRLACLIL